jgi:hypothetical protein
LFGIGGRRLERDCFAWSHPPFVPADAGTQFLRQSLGPRIRGDERSFELPIQFQSITLQSSTFAFVVGMAATGYI